MTGRLACAVSLSMLVAVSAGCGSGSSSSSSNPNSPSYDPAHTTLKAAGLEVCSHSQRRAVGGLDQSSGVTAVRSFFVAPDCMGAKTSPNQITLYQFNNRQSLDAGLPKIHAAYPNGQVLQYGAVVIVATGPDAAKYIADLKKVLPSAHS
jgi:hypothetical protein